jgi:hypothetical protein
MFEDLPKYQLEQLTKVLDCTSKAMDWRERALNEMGRPLATACTPEHLRPSPGSTSRSSSGCYTRNDRNSTADTPPTARRPAKTSSTGDPRSVSVRLPGSESRCGCRCVRALGCSLSLI